MLKKISYLLVFILSFLCASSYAAETTTYYHHDALGSAVAATDEGGNLLWREDYRPYGERIRNPTNTDNNLWYTGKPEEAQLGLQYFGARWYDPNMGRFTGIDPVGFSEGNIQSFNRYAYANNNPYVYVDPDGQAGILIHQMAAQEGVRGPEAWVMFLITGGDTPKSWERDIANAQNGQVNSSGFALTDGGPLVGRAASATRSAAKSIKAGLPDSAIVCRGGGCTADKFTKGSGVSTDSAGKLGGVSVNSAPGKSLQQLTEGIPHNKVGATTVGDVRKAGGNVVASPTKNNPNHATLSGVTAKQAEDLMTPTVKNPNR